MEKEQPDSLTTVTIKPEYAPSEVYSSEPPPAYMKPKSASVQVAKIVAVTVVLCTVVLGSFLLATAYVTANASCRQLEQELALLGEAADRFQPSGPLQPEALIQEQPIHKPNTEPLLQAEESNNKKQIKDIDNNIDDNNNDSSADNSDDSSADSSDESDDEDRPTIRFKLPLQLDFDDLAGAMIDRNQKSRMNCVVEKKRAEEIVDHQPKTVRLPFGVNLTTDPRYEKISGEKMAIFCESGHFQRAEPQQHQQQDDEEDSDDTIMIQPVMIPIPPSHFNTHMPVQQLQQQQQQPQQVQMIHPMETMRPPMPPMMQQFIPQPQQQQQQQMPPNPIIQHIIQQIIAQKIMEQQQQQQQQRGAQEDAEQSDIEQQQSPRMIIAQGMNRLPIPEEVLTQLNRLPNREGIVVVSQQQDVEDDDAQQDQDPAVQIVQHQRTSPDAMNGRQSYARGLPVDIPVPMMEQQQDVEQQEPQAAASEEARPHYVQPRSVRSVDALLPKSNKRVKRCSCDCAC